MIHFVPMPIPSMYGASRPSYRASGASNELCFVFYRIAGYGFSVVL